MRMLVTLWSNFAFTRSFQYSRTKYLNIASCIVFESILACNCILHAVYKLFLNSVADT